jgi:hypothetical protein
LLLSIHLSFPQFFSNLKSCYSNNKTQHKHKFIQKDKEQIESQNSMNENQTERKIIWGSGNEGIAGDCAAKM